MTEFAFRASSAGSCLRSIVNAAGGTSVPPSDAAAEPFLDMGHKFQDNVIEFLDGHGVTIVGVEAEGITDRGGYVIAGHVDGILDGSELLEVKAVTDAYFQKIAQADSWTEVYPHYKQQAWVYQGMPHLTASGGVPNYPGPFKLTRFVFVNRDNSQMYGGFPGVEHPKYIYRKDMVFRHNKTEYARTLKRHDTAAEHVRNNTIPDDCDAEGWCFHCQGFGRGGPSNKPLTVYLDADDEEFGGFIDAAIEYEQIKIVEARRKDLRTQLMKGAASINKSALEFAIDFGDEGILTVKLTEVRKMGPDGSVAREFANAGRIPWRPSEYKQLAVKRSA